MEISIPKEHAFRERGVAFTLEAQALEVSLISSFDGLSEIQLQDDQSSCPWCLHTAIWRLTTRQSKHNKLVFFVCLVVSRLHMLKRLQPQGLVECTESKPEV